MPPGRVAVACAALVLTVSACAAPDAGVTAGRSQRIEVEPPTTTQTTPTPSTATTPPTTSPPDSVPELPEIDPTTVIDFGGDRVTQPHDAVIAAYLTDIQSFWASEYERLTGTPFAPLAGGVHAAFADRQAPLPEGCGDVGTADLEGNAFYCPDGDFIVYDDDVLVPTLVDQFGVGTLGVVLAHEFGHAIQQRQDAFDAPVILLEQQADCFAGAWVAHAARGESELVQFGDDDVLDGLVAMIAVRDPLFGSDGSADSHGTGFDRVGAFQDGFLGGTDRCRTFLDEDRTASLVNIPFTVNDLQTQGNLPYDEIAGSIGDDLTRYWTAVYTAIGRTFSPPAIVAGSSCDGARVDLVEYCADDDTIVVDDAAARALYDTTLPSITEDAVRLGDMAVGYLLATAFADRVQRDLGADASDPDLASDCLAGAWVADIIPPFTEPRDLRLSAGDLDEAVVTALLTADERRGGDGRGPAFDKIDAFRAGVLGGAGACDL